MRKLHPFICLTHTHTNLHRRGGFREEEETVIVSPLHPTTSTLPLPPVIVILISCGGNLIFLCALCAMFLFRFYFCALRLRWKLYLFIIYEE